ncbi:MAG: helix-turn-helix domain-containing protein [Bacteroidaceae bacterium]|nr:helix-turn-helix domain-containing protein [Bacteroidaceae bacterium]
MKRLGAFLIISLAIAEIALADITDSLYRKAMSGRNVDYRVANQLFVALDAEGVTDSLITVDRHDKSDVVRQKICYHMGLLYNNTYRHRQAAEAFTQAAHYAQQIDNERARAEALSAAAVQHHLLGDFERAISQCTEALTIDSALHDAEALSCDLNILSGSSLSAGHTDDAVRYILKAIEWEKSRPHPTKLSIRYGSAAEILNKNGDTDKALHYASMAYELDKKAGNAIGVARRMSQMADIYVNRKEYPAAERYYRRAIDTLEAHGELHSLGIDYRLLGNVLQLEGQHAKAIECYEKAERLARQMGNRFFLSLVARSMAESHNALGHHDKAATYLQLALSLSDSLHSEKTKQMAADFRTQFELQEAQKNSEQQEGRVLVQRWIIVALLVLLLILLIVYNRRRRRQSATPTSPIEEAAQNQEGGHGIPAEPTEGESAMSAADRQFLVAVSDFVHANMKSRKITIDLLADEMCMSRNQFTRRLSAVSGETPNNYITRIKMEKAVRLLLDTTMPVKEVAYECGFDESNYFIHVFRQMYGTTPQQFRQTPGLKKNHASHQ